MVGVVHPPPKGIIRSTELVDDDARYMADPDNALLLMNLMALGPSTSELALTAIAPPWFWAKFES